MTTKYRYRIRNKALTGTILAVISLICMFFVTSCSMQGVTSNVTVAEDSSRRVYITMEGGSGRAYIESPVTVTTREQKSYATLVWSSENYDYVIVDGVRYDNENPGGKSTFTVPVDDFDRPLKLTGDTVAMSKPHEIEYTITWYDEDPETVGGEDDLEDSGISRELFGVRPAEREDLLIGGEGPDGKTELLHAEGFDIAYYGEMRLISIYGVGDYLLIPEGVEVPDDLPAEVTVLKQPLDRTYLVSTSVADLIRQAGALDMIRLSGLREDDWYIDEVRELMHEGAIVYAGKYRTPDYELILSEGCNLAIENTMIYHDPQVKEKLEELGIPVIVETSSYEKNPLGRLEWIKLYGTLFGREEEADNWYNEQEAVIGSSGEDTGEEKTVAVFYVSATGMINVRKPGDYITNMIELAGGHYVPEAGSIKSDGGMGTVNMQPEDFYAAVKDADILIYNGTIAGEVETMDDLIAKNELFADLKAVKEGNVYCLHSDFFQKTTGMAGFIMDMRDVINGGNGLYTFLTRLNNSPIK